ncbi:hypothetical protein TNCV_4426851 [Trichonephila clavipes]|nr:hypothetical protein TNCV_4426851 [Trichonephila clavipes]
MTPNSACILLEVTSYNPCKDLLPAPGNRSNETHDIEGRTWQRRRREPSERGENRERWREKRGRIKERRRDDGL